MNGYKYSRPARIYEIVSCEWNKVIKRRVRGDAEIRREIEDGNIEAL